MRIKSEEQWVARLSRSLALLSDRLDDPPSLQELAAAAHSSPFHFHRIWRALMGETVSQTVGRLRIALSQQRLRSGGASVTEAAVEGGFGTPQSFARAFRRVTGLTPTEFVAGKEGQEPASPAAQAIVRVELRPSCRLVAYHRHGGAYRELNGTFRIVWDWLASSGKLESITGIYGIPYDDPVSVPQPSLRYDAGFSLDGPFVTPVQFHIVEIPAGLYATLRHVGSYDDLESTDQALVEWLLGSSHEPADFPIIHQFHDDPDAAPTESLRADALLLLQTRDYSSC